MTTSIDTSTRSNPAGRVIFLNRETGAQELTFNPPSLAGATVLASSRSLLGDFVAASTTDGRVVLLQVRFLPVHGTEGLTGVKVDVRERGAVVIDPVGGRPQRVSYLEEGGAEVRRGAGFAIRDRALVAGRRRRGAAGRRRRRKR